MTVLECRKMTNMSQSKFANYIGVPVSTLQHWEQGYRTPPKYVIDLIHRVIKLELKSE